MLENTPISIEKFVHSFMQNLGSNVQAAECKKLSDKFQRMNSLIYADEQRKMKQDAARISERIKYILLQNSLDISDVQSVQLFIEKHTNFLDGFIYSGNVPFMAAQFKKINKRIVQRVKKMKMLNGVNVRKFETNMSYNKQRSPSKNYVNSCILGEDKKSNKAANIFHQNSAKQCDNPMDSSRCKQKVTYSLEEAERHKQSKKLLSIFKKKPYIGKINLSANIAQYTRKESELNRKCLELYVQDTDFIKKNISITLHIAIKELDKSTHKLTEGSYRQVLVLCKQAVSCLIEPSEKAFVLFDDDLPSTIHRHFLQNFKCHLNFPSDSVGYFALLVLSHWATVLVRHPNTTMMYTISNTLGCDTSKILVLSDPNENVL